MRYFCPKIPSWAATLTLMNLDRNIITLALCSAAFVKAGQAEETVRERADKSVKIPGLVLDLEKRCIDLEAEVSLDKGPLELVACTKGSKEHESIVAVSAKAMHIHTALLLLGASDGHPAIRRQVGSDKRWVNVPPRGDAVEVFLITTTKDGKSVECPIRDFIVRSRHRVDEVEGAVIISPEESEKSEDASKKRFPHTFVFAGSRLKEDGPGPRRYLADLSGNVISIATFGDELLCLPHRETREDNALMWRVKPGSLPRVGTKVTLRLRPKPKKSKPKAGAGKTVSPPHGGATSSRKTSGTDS